MIKNLIISILGKTEGYKEIYYSFEKKTSKSFLVSTSFKEYIGPDETHQLIFLPHTLSEDKNSIELLISDKNYSVELLPALVKDKKDKFKSFNFNASYNLVLYIIFLKLIQYYLKYPSLKNIYVDISIGLNIYIDALKEAARSFKVFSDLMNFTDNKKISFYLLFSDPVIGSNPNDNSLYNIFIEPIKTKVWFDSPIKKDDLTKNELNSIGLNKNQIIYLKNFYYTFFSLYRNAPLLITTFGYETKNSIHEELKKIIHSELNQFDINDNTFKVGSYPEISKFKLRQAIILSFALYYNISGELERVKINNSSQDLISLNEIKKFLEIYPRYNLNSNKELLERDLKNLDNLRSNLRPDEITTLAELEKKKVNKKININININKRNFFAHSGFEANITQIKKQNNDLLIGYNTMYKDKLKNYILKE